MALVKADSAGFFSRLVVTPATLVVILLSVFAVL